MLDFNEWLQCDLDRAGGSATSDVASASEFAARALDKVRKKLKKHGSALAETDDEHRHQVRKDAKKLRYAAEFFGSLSTTSAARAGTGNSSQRWRSCRTITERSGNRTERARAAWTGQPPCSRFCRFSR
ncbi:CHAD domain-containing protein [Rhizobium leguminosarum]|uniref:CHAD domain-containing protein n=1 Tax=Rhizobium leguminosarum TaxID=384 RepID=UPI0022782CE1|nr:CHAD domain-containing protein [Rhizobium leguminosarum]